jgi:MAF protein
LAWRVAPAEIAEVDHLLPEASVAALNVALAKARATPTVADEVVVAADTLVVAEGDILGKPADADQAHRMLARLCGRAHQVHSGVALVRDDRLQWCGVVDTRVVMRAYTQQEQQTYVARGEPFDKAGGYAVQDEVFRPVERIEGCYLNVVGLPLCAVAAGLTALGTPVEAAGALPCGYCARGQPLIALRMVSAQEGGRKPRTEC